MAMGLDCLGRALDEVEALQAIFEENCAVIDEVTLLEARSVVESGGASLPAAYQPPRLDVEISVELEPENDGNGAAVGLLQARLRCGMPPGYPEMAATASAHVEGLSRQSQNGLSTRLQGRAAELAGTEAVMELVEELRCLAPPLLQTDRAAVRAAPEPEPERAVFGRRWLWMHHIKNPTKRKNIVAWARELNLSGYSKPGYPGVVVVEGLSAHCDEFIDWLRTRTGNWKALTLRGQSDTTLFFGGNSSSGSRGVEDDREAQGAGEREGLPSNIRELTLADGVAAVAVAVDAQRRLAFPFEELGENDMGTLAETCKTAGVGDEFLQHIMQHRITSGGAGAAPADV